MLEDGRWCVPFVNGKLPIVTSSFEVLIKLSLIMYRGVYFMLQVILVEFLSRRRKDESKQCMLPIFKETYIASLPSSPANVYGADTVDMFIPPV